MATTGPARSARIAAALLALAQTALAADSAVLQSETDRVAVVEKVAPTVVAIFSPGGGGGGSGVLITGDGLALTNFHVVNGAGNFMKCGLNDGVLYDAVIVGIDPTGDVALIKLFGRDDFPHAALGDSDALAVGDWTFAMGNPFLLATDFSPTVTFGIVSGVHRYQEPAGTFLEYTDCIQTDASINPGNSGGPLFNARGELVGINGRGSFEKRGRVNSGAGYAISINQIKHFLDALKGGLVVDHATLGATVATRDDGAMIVTGILEHSEAYRRGLRIDDEIVSFAGRPLRSVNQFKNVLGIYPKGWKLPLVFRHEGRKQEIMVRLRGLHRQSELTPERPARGRRGGPRPPDEERRRRGRGERPGDRPKDEPDQPTQQPRAQRPAVPEHLAKFYAPRAGFVNYYFNSLERDRTLRSLREWGDYAKETGVWKLTGTLAPVNQPFELTLGDKVAGLSLAGGKQIFAQELTADAKLEDEPPQSGGLLLALHHLRTLLVRGPEGFSESYYLGSEPLDGVGTLVDVILCEKYGARSHWFFSKESGQCVGFDSYLEDDVDPCEVRFQQIAAISGRQLPTAVSVRSGEKEFGRFQIEAANFGQPPETPSAQAPVSEKTDSTSKSNPQEKP